MTTKAIINGPVVSKKKLEIIQEHSGVQHNILGMLHDVAGQAEDGSSIELIIGNARVQFSGTEFELGDEETMKQALLSNLQQDDSVLALVVPEGKPVPERDPALAGDELRMMGISLAEPVQPVVQQQESLDNIVRRQLGLDPIPTPADIEAQVRAQLQASQPSVYAGSVSQQAPLQGFQSTGAQFFAEAPQVAQAQAPVFQHQEAFVVTMTFMEVQSDTILATSLEEAERQARERAETQRQVFQNLGKHVVVSTDVRAVSPRIAQAEQAEQVEAQEAAPASDGL